MVYNNKRKTNFTKEPARCVCGFDVIMKDGMVVCQ